jgi:hypothetical protein
MAGVKLNGEPNIGSGHSQAVQLVPLTPVHCQAYQDFLLLLMYGIFNGAFFYFLQNIINTKHQLVLKYDWYDPNIKVSKTEIGKPGTNLTAADIKFSTLGVGYVYYFNSQTKITFYYDIVENEKHN